MIAIKEISKEDIDLFELFLSSDRKDIPNLKYSELPYPHEEIAIISGDYDLCDDILPFGLSVKRDCFGSTVISRNEVSKIGDAYYLFSGYMINGNDLIWGGDEFSSSKCSLVDTREAYGEFALLSISSRGVELSSDYFGMEPWFYYDDGSVFAASNHYHLLIMLLKYSGIKLSMNIDRSKVNLITSGFSFGSCFTKEMDIKNIYVTLPYEKVRYSYGKTIIDRTSLYDVISTKEEWDDEIYEEYISKSCEEIQSNVKAFFTSAHFEQVVIDVSGGFDSRIVFAAANNLEKRYRDKIVTHTRTSGTKDDVSVAYNLLGLLDYRQICYENYDEKDELIDLYGDIDCTQMSRTLGCFSVNTDLYRKNYDICNRIQLTGGIGDAVFGYKRIRGELDYSLGDEKLLSRIGGSYIWNSVFQLSNVFSKQNELITHSINVCPCDDLFQKFHLLYLLYRNRFNFGNAHNVEYNNPRATVLHTKYGLKAKLMYFHTYGNNNVPDEKICLDIIARLNPLFSLMPFASNNDDVIPNADKLLYPYKAKVISVKEIGNKNTYNENKSDSYKFKVKRLLQDTSLARDMVLKIYDYSNEYKDVCLGIFCVLNELDKNPADLDSGHAREQIRKIMDVYYESRFCINE